MGRNVIKTWEDEKYPANNWRGAKKNCLKNKCYGKICDGWLN